MLNPKHYIVVARIKPKEGAKEKLLALRERLVEEFKQTYPQFVSASLYGVEENDEWRDVVVFSEMPPLDPPTNAPVYEEWSALVDGTGFELLEPI
ncbi:hypothetical protein PS673_05760 [Pseudomonas fluorescens]|uniref:ABM domain-containing protein n=1 Tax=Pseudomonas fluorescens TaxID=294 RepID=A0A5E6Y052_PSEFL|nr:hypothetical protein [Pseudomonas fluorescens]VVN46089.1 hypothetical protein PS673_05760 [Pseudomonas fluorescens]